MVATYDLSGARRMPASPFIHRSRWEKTVTASTWWVGCRRWWSECVCVCGEGSEASIMSGKRAWQGSSDRKATPKPSNRSQRRTNLQKPEEHAVLKALEVHDALLQEVVQAEEEEEVHHQERELGGARQGVQLDLIIRWVFGDE